MASSKRILAGGTALVTGASSGIGRALCQALAERGLRLVLSGRSAERTEQTRQSLPNPEQHHTVVGELTDDGFIAELCEQTRKVGQGSLALLVHSAASYQPQPLETLSAEDFDTELATNLRAPFLLSCGLLPCLRSARGQIAFINSSAVNNPRAEIAAYTVSKAGLRAFADCLRASVNPQGIRVLSVFPGRTATPLQQAQFAREGRPYRPELLLQPEDVAAAVLASLELAETAELTELHIRPNVKS